MTYANEYAFFYNLLSHNVVCLWKKWLWAFFQQIMFRKSTFITIIFEFHIIIKSDPFHCLIHNVLNIILDHNLGIMFYKKEWYDWIPSKYLHWSLNYVLSYWIRVRDISLYIKRMWYYKNSTDTSVKQSMLDVNWYD